MTACSTHPDASSGKNISKDGTLTIREANADDFDRYLPVVKGILTQGSYSKLNLDIQRARSSFEQWLADTNRFIQVAELDSRPVGVLIGYVSRQWFSSDLTGHDTLLLVAPSHRTIGIGSALVSSFVEWCSARGTALVFLSSSVGVATEAAQKVYEKSGFRLCGPIYLKETGNV